jgi:hypothetical protein
MCRFQCTDPKTCKVSKYSLGSIKSQQASLLSTTASNDDYLNRAACPSKFERNRSVQFFSGSSDSEFSSDDEMTFFPLEQNERQKQQQVISLNLPESLSTEIILSQNSKTITSNDSSIDSGFTEEENTDSDENTIEEKPQLKSILLRQRFNIVEEDKPKKKVKFADDCGKFLIKVRYIPARQKLNNHLLNDIVDLRQCSKDEENFSSGWRDAILYKLLLTAGFSVGNSLQSSTTTSKTVADAFYNVGGTTNNNNIDSGLGLA